MRWVHGARARLRLMFAPRAAEARMSEEMRFHVEMEAEKLVREQGRAASSSPWRRSASSTRTCSGGFSRAA